jgi:hypothetical protein
MMLAAAAIVRVRPLAAGDGLRRGRNEVAWTLDSRHASFDICWSQTSDHPFGEFNRAGPFENAGATPYQPLFGALAASAVEAGRLVCCTRSSPSSRSVAFSVSLRYQLTPRLSEAAQAEVELRAAAWRVEGRSALEPSDFTAEDLVPALRDVALAAVVLIVCSAAVPSFLPFG